MSSEESDMKETADSEEERIDFLKEEQKQKLGAAEEVYAQRQGYSAVEPAPEVEEQPEQRRGKEVPWLPGVILIGMGAIFLINNVTGIQINNWWALFILIPAVGSFSKAAEAIRRTGGLTREAWSGLAMGIIFCLVAAAFLFGLSWNLIWPVFMIIGGIGLLVGGLSS